MTMSSNRDFNMRAAWIATMNEFENTMDDWDDWNEKLGQLGLDDWDQFKKLRPVTAHMLEVLFEDDASHLVKYLSPKFDETRAVKMVIYVHDAAELTMEKTKDGGRIANILSLNHEE